MAALPNGWKRFLGPPISEPGDALGVRSVRSFAGGLARFLNPPPSGAPKQVRVEFPGTIPAGERLILEAEGLGDIIDISEDLEHRGVIERPCASQVLFLMEDGASSKKVIPGKL